MTYILLAGGEDDQLELLGHGVEELLCVGPDVEDHLEG